MLEEAFEELSKSILDMLEEISGIALIHADKIHDIRRYGGNIDKDYIRDEKGKKIYLTYEDWRKEKKI